jgi:hypothetical protein
MPKLSLQDTGFLTLYQCWEAIKKHCPPAEIHSAFHNKETFEISAEEKLRLPASECASLYHEWKTTGNNLYPEILERAVLNDFLSPFFRACSPQLWLIGIHLGALHFLYFLTPRPNQPAQILGFAHRRGNGAVRFVRKQQILKHMTKQDMSYYTTSFFKHS